MVYHVAPALLLEFGWLINWPARKILTEGLEGNFDIDALIGEDENGNLWIYSSVEAEEAAGP